MMDILQDLARKARHAESDRELGFLLVNDSLALAPYRQAALWLAEEGVWSLSGVVQVDANVPYAQWLDAVAHHLQALGGAGLRPFTASDLPADLAVQWHQWWPEHALWLGSEVPGIPGAGLLVRDAPWTPEELAMLQEWADMIDAWVAGKSHTPTLLPPTMKVATTAAPI